MDEGHKLPSGLIIEDREHAPAEVFDIAIKSAHAEITECINQIYREINECVNTEHPMYLSGLRKAVLLLRARAKETGVPVLIEDDITTPVEGLPGD